MGEQDRVLAELGVAPHAADALVQVVRRDKGLVVLCGPAGVGKTTLAEALARVGGARLLGDLRFEDEVRAALWEAQKETRIAVVRSGESTRLRARWGDMGISTEEIDRADVVTVTLRRLRRVVAASADLLVVEVLATDGSRMTGSLVEEAAALVSAGLATASAARFDVPDYP